MIKEIFVIETIRIGIAHAKGLRGGQTITEATGSAGVMTPCPLMATKTGDGEPSATVERRPAIVGGGQSRGPGATRGLIAAGESQDAATIERGRGRAPVKGRAEMSKPKARDSDLILHLKRRISRKQSWQQQHRLEPQQGR
jgi:hypothetical protein